MSTARLPKKLLYRFKELAPLVLTSSILQKIPLHQANFEEHLNFSWVSTSNRTRLFLRFGFFWLSLRSFLIYKKRFHFLHPAQKKDFIDYFFKNPPAVDYLLFRPISVFILTSYYAHPKVAKLCGFENEKENLNHIKIPSSLQTLFQTTASVIEEKVEVCVIGSGAGGAVVAKELAEKGHDVLILEQGGPFDKNDFNQLSTIARNNLIYRDGGFFVSIGVPPILIPTGQCVGGTTVINSGTCFRTPKPILEKWQKDYSLHFDDQSLAPYFDRVEKTINVVPVSSQLMGGNNQTIQQGLEKINLSHHPLDRNVKECQKSGVCIFGCPTGAKQSMEQSYLPLAFKAGARIYPYCEVKKLYHQLGQVSHVKAILKHPNGTKKHIIIHAKKFILACGTINSPLLLKKSGLAQSSSALGKNLTIHPTGKMFGLFDHQINGHLGVPQALGVSAFQEQGILFESVFLPPWLFAASLHETPEKMASIMQHYQNIAMYGFLVHDEGRGSVHLGPDGQPMVLYQLGKPEMNKMLEGIKILAKILFAAGARSVFSTLKSLGEIHSIEKIEKINPNKVKFSDWEIAGFHPLGTCRMGLHSRSSVVNPEMRVHGMDNLWIADGSIFPSSLGVNPQVSIMTFASLCADIIHQKK